MGWGSGWNQRGIVTGGSSWPFTVLEMTRSKKLVTDGQGEGMLGCSAGAVVAASLQTPKESSPLSSSPRLPAQRKPRWKLPELKWPSIYQALRCHEVPCVSALGEKPDLSVIGSDVFTGSFCGQERETELQGRKEQSPWGSFFS